METKEQVIGRLLVEIRNWDWWQLKPLNDSWRTHTGHVDALASLREMALELAIQRGIKCSD